MLYSEVTLNSFIVFIVVGMVAGIVYDVLYLFKAITKHNILVVNVLDLLCCLFSGFILIFCIFKFEKGNFALFEVVSFVFGIIFEQIIVKNLFTSPFKWVYNKITLRKIKQNFSKE